MIKNLILRLFVSIPLLVTAVNAQDGVDAIEKARQAKEAADKAAAEAAAATEAAIEAAAAKAAKAARADAKKKKEDDEARRAAEKLAAEEAELDAAATAAAEEAKRKMAAELGLEVASDEPTEGTTVAGEEEIVEEVTAKEKSGFGIGGAASVGLMAGETFSNVPTGGTFVLTTPLGFKVGPFDYTVSLAFGGYTGTFEGESGEMNFDPSFAGIGGNLTLFDMVFAEGHVGNVGFGPGFRGFAGVKVNLNLPVNILAGSEVFYSSEMTEGGAPSGWASLGLRLDYSF